MSTIGSQELTLFATGMNWARTPQPRYRVERRRVTPFWGRGWARWKVILLDWLPRLLLRLWL